MGRIRSCEHRVCSEAERRWRSAALEILSGFAGLRGCLGLRRAIVCEVVGWVEESWGVDSRLGWGIRVKSSGIPAVEGGRCMGRE